MTAVHAPRPLRETRQAAVVEQALSSSEEFRTAQDLHAQLRAAGLRIGLTTVYRHLQRLTDAGTVDAVRTRTGEVAYRRCADQGHHHHLVCQGCGRVVDIDGPSVENWLDEVAKRAGFTDIEHTLELTGTCRDCARGGGGTRDA